MKLLLLILFTFSLNAEEMSPAQQKIKNCFTLLSAITSPCTNLMGADKTYCEAEFAKQKSSTIKVLVKEYLSGVTAMEYAKVDAMELLKRTKAKLDLLGIVYKADATQSELDILIDSI